MAARQGGPRDGPETELDRIVAGLLPGRGERAARLFTDTGARAPRIVWSPGPPELNEPPLEGFAALCAGIAGHGVVVPRASFDLATFAEFADWLMLLDAEDGGRSFRYVHYGAGVAQHFGRDMTGRSSADFGGHISLFLSALYLAAQARREWVLSEHEPPLQLFPRSWRRLIVPLGAADGSVDGFVTVSAPDTELRAGLEIFPDPVFLVDEKLAVRFANRAARDLFRADPIRTPGRSLKEITGIALEAELPPLDMVHRRVVHDRVHVTIGGAVSDEFLVTVNAALHRGRAFYVVTVRLMGG